MFSRIEVESAVDAIGAAQSIADLRELMIKFRDEAGLAHIAYHAVTFSESSDRLLILTYHANWVDRYIERDYFSIDPLVIQGPSSFLPVDWSNVDRTGNVIGEFFRDAERYGVGTHGVTMTIRRLAGERALFSVSSNSSDDEWARIRFVHMRDFQLVAHFVHDRAMTLGGYRTNLHPNLSRRETDCLRLLVEGLAPKAIAASLGISNSAVQLYLASARQKLGCGSLSAVAVRAARLEIV